MKKLIELKKLVSIMKKRNEIFAILKEYNDIQIEEWLIYKNISREKCELFHDFIISLYDIIDTTFLGIDVLYDLNDQKNHFKWCWQKNIENFKKEKIYFNNNKLFFNNFQTFFLESFYGYKEENLDSKIPLFINLLFDFNVIKSEKELIILEHIYNLININLKK